MKKPPAGPKPQHLVDLRVLRAEILSHLARRGLRGHLGADPLGADDATPAAMSLAANDALTALRKSLGDDVGDIFDVRMAIGEFRSACFWTDRKRGDVDRKHLDACISCRNWMKQQEHQPEMEAAATTRRREIMQ
jgi:hypothetical protein